MKTTTVELDCGKNRICVYFGYDPENVHAVKRVGGATYVKTPVKHWHVPQDLETCRQLRKQFGESLQIGPTLHSWAVNASRAEASLRSLALADSATLTRLPSVLPTLARAIHVGPIGLTFNDAQWATALAKDGSYQAADVQFLALAQAPLIANEQGTGKTPTIIAETWESSREVGNHLVSAPSAAVDGTWEPELEKWQTEQADQVGIFCCTGTRAQREATIEEFKASTKPVKWLVVNNQMLSYRIDRTRQSPITVKVVGKEKKAKGCKCKANKDVHEHYESPYPELDRIQWRTFIIDEGHKGSVRNHKTVTSLAMRAIKAEKRIVATGTPMKKKGADVWGILNFLRPDVFTSYWRFAGEYFDIDDNGFGKKVGELLEEKEEDFFRLLTPYVVRRTKAEVAPWLPPKHFVPVWCRMGPKQEKQYRKMEEDGSARLEGGEVNTTSILAEFTRLSQFASTVCEVRDGKVFPTMESCKLDAMFEKMDEANLFDEGNTDKQIVFSESRQVIEMVAEALREKGRRVDPTTGEVHEFKVDIISGGQSRKGQRRQIKEEFQEGDTRVLCIVTTAGGVSLTLDAADVAHFLDESWAPDVSEQAEDRLHRVSRVHQVTIYQYRTKDTIDEYRMQTAFDKAQSHKYILDVRRQMLKEAS